jgi:hypothetical protein
VAVFNLVFFLRWLAWAQIFSALSISMNADPRGTNLSKEPNTTLEVHALLTPFFVCKLTVPHHSMPLAFRHRDRCLNVSARCMKNVCIICIEKDKVNK